MGLDRGPGRSKKAVHEYLTDSPYCAGFLRPPLIAAGRRQFVQLICNPAVTRPRISYRLQKHESIPSFPSSAQDVVYFE